MLADGLIELWLAAGQGRRRERWWQTAISGGLGVLFGLSNMLGRGLSPGDRVYMISARMAAGSVSGIMTIRALQLDRLTERLLLAGGSGGICLAVLLMVMRFEIRVAPLVRLIGGFTLLLGLLLWLAALRLRGLGGSTLAAAPR